MSSIDSLARDGVLSAMTGLSVALAAQALVSPSMAAPAGTAARVTPNLTQPNQPNILNMSEGTVVLSYTGETSQTNWSALNAFDGNLKTGWCSANGGVSNQTFVVELPQQYKLQMFVVDNSIAQENGYEGISSKNVEVWGSTSSADSGFTKLLSVEAPKVKRAAFPFPSSAKAQWLKIIVKNNWGHKQFIEVGEFEAYGQPVGTAVNPTFTGIYSSNWGPIKLKQVGSLVSGCYTHKGGSIRGAVTGHVLRFDWAQKGNGRTGTAMMVLNSAGTVLNGVWYANGRMGGEWLGKKDDSQQCQCEPAPVATGIANLLMDVHRAVIYGIHFDTNSAVIKPQSEPALKELLNALNRQPSMKIEIQGHTDSQNSDQYNNALSQKRAQAVMAWLVAHKIPAARMKAIGFGESSPIADNATPQGRALNRRVEVATFN